MTILNWLKLSIKIFQNSSKHKNKILHLFSKVMLAHNSSSCVGHACQFGSSSIHFPFQIEPQFPSLLLSKWFTLVQLDTIFWFKYRNHLSLEDKSVVHTIQWQHPVYTATKLFLEFVLLPSPEFHGFNPFSHLVLPPFPTSL